MKKLNLFLVFAFIILGRQVSAQFHAINPEGCGDGVIKIVLDTPNTPSYSGVCDSDPSIYLPTNQYIYQIFYSYGTYELVSGPLGWYTENTGMYFKATPNSFTNSGMPLEVRITRYKERISDHAMVQCVQESVFVYPKKRMEFSGPTYLEDLSILNYSVTNVPGVNFTWTLPSGWSIVSSNSNSSSIQVSPTGGSGNIGSISVSSNPTISACDWPVVKQINLSDCFYNGQTQYDFCTPQTNWGNSLLGSDFNDSNKWPRMMGDFNGDGKDDLIGFGNTAVTVGLSTGSNFNYATWTNGFTYGTDGSNQTQYPRMIGDFNGDQKDDIIGFGNQLTYVGLSSGSAFSTSGFTPTAYFTYSQGFTGWHLPRFVGDFNGDGKDDVLACGHSSTSVGISTGSSFNVSGWSGGVTFSTTDGGFGDPDKYPRMIGDFNGDGKKDIIGFGHTDVVVGLSTGSSFNVSTWTHSFTYGNDGILQSSTPRGIGDFNGDGKDDIILFGHTAVVVGLSTGTSFVVSNWFNYHEFTIDGGWPGLSLSPTGSSRKVIIKDVNGDGKDDLVGFNSNGTYVAYSKGNIFMCSDFDNSFDLNGARFVGNFDNTDDQAEIVAINYSDLKVMDCNFCVTSVANASLTGNYAVAAETAGSNTVNVHKYCTNTLGIDLSTTTCEDRYSIEIKPYNLSAGTAGAAIYQTGWIIQNAPSSINLSGITNLQVGQLYVLNYSVGPTTNTKSLYFKITSTTANFTNTPNQTRLYPTSANPTGYTIGQYCTNVLSFGVNGVASGCYDDYRYEVIEVFPPFMIPNSNSVPIQQIPVGGGWNNGPIASHSISMSGIVSGKIYRIRLYVRRNGVTSTFDRLVERNDCMMTPPKELLKDEVIEFESDPVSLLYPNPATNNLIINPAGYDEEQVTGEIYDSYGKLVGNTTLETGKDNTIDLLELSPGMYLIKLQGNNRVEKLSFIKQ